MCSHMTGFLFFILNFVLMLLTVFRLAIKALAASADTYRPLLLKTDTEMRVWKYEIDTIVVTEHNRRLLWRGKCFENQISLQKFWPKTRSTLRLLKRCTLNNKSMRLHRPPHPWLCPNLNVGSDENEQLEEQNHSLKINPNLQPCCCLLRCASFRRKPKKKNSRQYITTEAVLFHSREIKQQRKSHV